MRIVVDASVALSWFFGDERAADASDLWDAVVAGHIVVPSIWSYELTNRLGRAIAAGETTRSEVERFLEALSRIRTDLQQPSTFTLLRRIADSGLTADDAAYLEIAAARGIPLATFDAKLRAAAEAAGVTVFPGAREF